METITGMDVTSGKVDEDGQHAIDEMAAGHTTKKEIRADNKKHKHGHRHNDEVDEDEEVDSKTGLHRKHKEDAKVGNVSHEEYRAEVAKEFDENDKRQFAGDASLSHGKESGKSIEEKGLRDEQT